MKFYVQDFLLSISRALDQIEQDLVGGSTNHGKRVACVCAKMAAMAGLNQQQICDLSAYGIMHDNALSEYLHTEYKKTGQYTSSGEFSLHCTIGENNIRHFPFFEPAENAILYHHENADGSGLFKKTTKEVHPYSRWIHIADNLDIHYDLSDVTEEKYDKICNFTKSQKDKMFSSEDVELFLSSVTYDFLRNLQQSNIDAMVAKIIPPTEMNFTNKQLMEITSIFARITDYKSIFTSDHSRDIANRCYKLAEYYNYDEDKCTKMFMAGALHDIGKLFIDVSILEKPGKLTLDEYEIMKNHAKYSYDVLKDIKDFEEITRWACLHHEKLDGSGYPFGYTASELSHEERIMCCLDVYQALREIRPYKSQKTHVDSIAIMREMEDTIDQNIVSDIEKVFVND